MFRVLLPLLLAGIANCQILSTTTLAPELIHHDKTNMGNLKEGHMMTHGGQMLPASGQMVQPNFALPVGQGGYFMPGLGHQNMGHLGGGQLIGQSLQQPMIQSNLPIANTLNTPMRMEGIVTELPILDTVNSTLPVTTSLPITNLPLTNLPLPIPAQPILPFVQQPFLPNYVYNPSYFNQFGYLPQNGGGFIYPGLRNHVLGHLGNRVPEMPLQGNLPLEGINQPIANTPVQPFVSQPIVVPLLLQFGYVQPQSPIPVTMPLQGGNILPLQGGNVIGGETPLYGHQKPIYNYNYRFPVNNFHGGRGGNPLPIGYNFPGMNLAN